jgi:CHAT domain-containing protein/tetratricopeptide (TPR) repeat protein
MTSLLTKVLKQFALIMTFCSVNVVIAFGQDHYGDITRQAFEHIDKKEYPQALALGEELFSVYPDDVNASAICAYSLINLSRVAEAEPYISTALKVDPTNYSAYLNGGYYFAALGNETMAKSYFTESMKVLPAAVNVSELAKEIETIGTSIHKSERFNSLARWYEITQKTSTAKYTSIEDFRAIFKNQIAKGPEAIKAEVRRIAGEYERLKWHEMVVAIYSTAGLWLLQGEYRSDAMQMAQAAYSYYLKNGCRENPDQAAFMYYILIKTSVALGNDEQAIQYNDEIVALSPKLKLHVYDVMSLVSIASSYYGLNKIDESKKFAVASYKVAESYGYKFGIVSGAGAIVTAYSYNASAEDLNIALSYGEHGIKLAQEYMLDDVVGQIVSSLTVTLYRLGTAESLAKSIKLTGSLVALYKSKNRWGDASVTLNNAGAIFFFREDYDYAARLFEESIQVGEQNIHNLSYEDRLTFYQSQISAYQFLTFCYAKLNKTEKVFEMMEGSRGRVLGEKLAGGKSLPKLSIADVQQKLAEDEACIEYALFSGHEVIILVITKKYANVLIHTDYEFIRTIKDKYFDRINKEHGDRKGIDSDAPFNRERAVLLQDFHKVTQLTRKFFENPGMADPILDEYLRGYFKFLILPVSNRLSNIKRLIISPDNVLNFIPFEALRSGDGKYLVEKYGIRYMHSASVLNHLDGRVYSPTRKPLLAMGGAVFQEMNTVEEPIRTQQDLNKLQVRVEENRKNGRSQREAYASLFGKRAMNYLPGTVDEVKNVAAVVPGSEIFLGEQMTENKIKSLSTSGFLKNFKVLHFATHGFVVNEAPALSGIATSIFSNEQNDEDGFLTTDEIANLQVNADLTILSACQTALGKIYSGEGVTGLTQSLILAGSNAALVSLWPVNDNSTMLFMSGLYKETQKGKPYNQVVNELKRKFIEGDFGDEYKHPNYWAPFIYIGK